MVTRSTGFVVGLVRVRGDTGRDASAGRTKLGKRDLIRKWSVRAVAATPLVSRPAELSRAAAVEGKRLTAPAKLEKAKSTVGKFLYKSSKSASVSDGTDSSLSQFCREVRKVNMLEDREVIQCAKAVKELMQWEKKKLDLTVKLGRDATDDEWAKAVAYGGDVDQFRAAVRELHRLKDLLVAANLRLVVSIARKYANNGVMMSDLIQEGSLGLIRGAERFDHTKGFRFATYTSWWIKQAIQRSITVSSRLIRLPVGVFEIKKRIARAREELSVSLMRPPTEEELAEKVGIPRARLRFVLQKTVETSTVSLHTPVAQETADNTTTIGDLIETDHITPEESLHADLLRCDLENVLLMLTPREREVVRMRFGFDDGKTKDYQEIGEYYCVDSSRIRQIERRAMRKLRHPTLNAVLRDYVS